jgi:hypothetical protein
MRHQQPPTVSMTWRSCWRLKSPLKMLPLEATCGGCPPWEALHVAMTLAITWPFAFDWPDGTIRSLPNVGGDEVSYKRCDALAEVGAELAKLVLLDIV